MDLEHPCPNCANPAQTVTAVTHGNTAAVTCNRCVFTRRHVFAVVEATSTAVVAQASKAPVRRTRKRLSPWAPETSLVAAVLSRPARAYRASDTYHLGDRVEHVTFGLGIVDEILGPTKMQVFFPSGHRKMVHGTP